MSAMLSVFMLCLPGPAWAQPDAFEESRSVRSLYGDCTGLNVDYCDGYLSGVANALDQQRHYNQKWREQYYPPSITRASIYRETFASWAERSKFWTSKRYDGVLVAFWMAYFCPNY
jgi:hypothetical protein